MPDQEAEPGGGEPIEVTLYWQAVEAVAEDYLSTVHLLGRDNRSVGQVDRYPAGGMVPTSQWQAGQIWRDVYHVYVNEDAAAPARLRILATLYDAAEEADVTAVGPDGTTAELLIIGEARLGSGSLDQMEIVKPLEISFADNITLLGYDFSSFSAVPGEDLTIDLFWQAAGRPLLDYTVFVQLLDSSGNQVAGADGPPVNGDFPTGWWRSGDMVVDAHLMQIPADIATGDYTVLIGLYDPLTGQRLVRVDGQGDAVSLPLTIGQ
jgi:hypothetical protein